MLSRGICVFPPSFAAILHSLCISVKIMGMGQKNAKGRHGRRESLLYSPLWSLVPPALSFYVRGNKLIVHPYPEDELKTPCIIVSNHCSFMDWYIVKLCFKRLKIHFLTSNYYLDGHWYSSLLRKAGLIGKDVFSADRKSAIECVRTLKMGGVLGLFPEARISASSHSEDFPEETATLIKRMGITVYAVKIEGASLMMPKWGGLNRNCVVEATAKKLFDGPELKEMSTDEIQWLLKDAISFDDFEYLERHPEMHISLKDGAKGLGNILFRCPACKKDGTIESDGMNVRCTSCGFETTMDDRYHFHDGPYWTIQEWHEAIRKKYQDEIAKNPDFKLSGNARIRGKEGYAGSGVCSLSRDGLSYVGTDSGKEVSLFFPSSSFYVLPYKAGDNFVIFDKGRCYVFCLENGKETVMWSLFSDEMQKERKANDQHSQNE